MRLIVDISVALPWAVASQATSLTEQAGRHSQEHGAVVPFHFHLELTNALLMLERRGRLTEADVGEALESMSLIGLDVDEAPIAAVATTILPLARRFKLTLYDAAYLELALRTELPLATRDRELAAAAISAGAELFAP